MSFACSACLVSIRWMKEPLGGRMEVVMKEERYIISDAAKKLKVEPHALRYWEEELGIEIPRNEMGHRYYKKENLELMEKIKKLKERGLHLKAIKLVMDDIDSLTVLDEGEFQKVKEELNMQVEGNGGLLPVEGVKRELRVEHERQGDKMEQFKLIMKEIIGDVLRESNQNFCDSVSSNVSDNVRKEMDYLMREKEEREEERFRQLDEIIREVQKSRQEAAAADLSTIKPIRPQETQMLGKNGKPAKRRFFRK